MNKVIQITDRSAENSGPPPVTATVALNTDACDTDAWDIDAWHTDAWHTDAWENVCGATDLFSKSLILGRVRGIVGIVGMVARPESGTIADPSEAPDDAGRCDNGSDYVELVRELISRDILVLAFAGKTAPSLPPALSAPELCKNADDGLAEFCDFIGTQPVVPVNIDTDDADVFSFLHDLAERAAVAVPDLPCATIAGATEQPLPQLGIQFNPAATPTETADRLDQHIHDKRISAQWCDRCGGRFSPFS